MNGLNFTERVKTVLALAREEAEPLLHEYVGTEHILLGLLREGMGVGIATLQNLGLEPSEVRESILGVLQRGKKSTSAGRDLPYTSRAKKVLELSLANARDLNHMWVGTEHLLLGLLDERQGIAAQILNSFGVTADRARMEIVRLHGAEVRHVVRVTGMITDQFDFTSEGARKFKSVPVAIVQAEIAPTLSAGMEKTATLAREAAAGGAKIIVFPETWLPGYPAWLDVSRDANLWDHPPVKSLFERHAAESVDVGGQDGAKLSKLAAEVGAVIVIGVVERVSRGPASGTLFNSLLIYSSDGRLLNHHRKLMPTHTERLMWGQGDTAGLSAVDTPVARIGGLICWEHWMPLARQAVHDSGEFVHAALWPSLSETHHLASRHYAFEGRCFVLAAGSLMRASALPKELEPHPDLVGSDGWVLRGGSAIIGPDGSYIVEPVYEKEMILTATLDLGAVAREHMTLDVAGHYSRPDCFEFHVRRSGREIHDAR